MRALHGKVAAVRPHFTIDTLRQALHEFHDHGLLYVWRAGSKVYGHWTNSEKEGRLPPLSQRPKFQKLAPLVPKINLYRYLQDSLSKAQPMEQQGLALSAPSPGLGFGVGVGVGKDLMLIEPEPSTSAAFRETYSNEFDSFWEAYPKKVSKLKARRAWKKTRCAGHLGEILASITDWKKTTQWSDSQFIPYPASWLNQELWKETVPKETDNGTRQKYQRATNAVNSGRPVDPAHKSVIIDNS
jgi:hypothetical protein